MLLVVGHVRPYEYVYTALEKHRNLEFRIWNTEEFRELPLLSEFHGI